MSSLALNARAPLVVALALVAACTIGPDYERPGLDLPSGWKSEGWKSGEAREIEAASEELASWWTALDDAVLDGLVAEALDANLDLRLAAARIDEARARIGAAAGRYYPQTVADASYARTRFSENGVQAGLGTVDVAEVGVGFAWELDVFGRLRRGVESAEAFADASVEDWRDVLVILLADVAAGYVDARTLQARLTFARDNAESQAATLRLTRDRFDAGLTSARDVAQAEANLATTEATIPALERELELTRNRLSVLLGSPPGAVDERLAERRPIPEPASPAGAVLPAELLRRRPDVRAAERRLAGQTASIGAAEGELYPIFSLGGDLALQSTETSTLFDSASRTWSLAPGVRWNVFNGGRVRSLVRVEEARAEQALVAYEQTVLLALEEVENALVSTALEAARRDRLQAAVDASVRALDLVRTQYRSGLTDFQSYLDTERVLTARQDDLAASRGRVVLQWIALQRALGGGWTPPDEERSEP